MALKFSPNGYLDLSTDPSELPGETDGAKGEISGAMRRCTNLILDQTGIASTRPGSSLVNEDAMSSTIPYKIIEQDGHRICFNDTEIYLDESSIETGLVSDPWSAIQYNQYNSANRSVYALNNKERKRIENGIVYKWGIAAPEDEATIEAVSLGGANVVHVSYDDVSYNIRPVAAGDETNLASWPATRANYICVGEETPDNRIVRNRTVDTTKRDLYAMDDYNGTGDINYIRVWMRCYTTVDGATAQTALSIDGEVYDGDSEDLGTSGYVNYFTEYETHPLTDESWTWQNVIDLQAGLTLSYGGRCTQLWVEVSYQTETRTEVASQSPIGLTGDYDVKYTYARKEGDTVVSESNPSDSVTLDNRDYAFLHPWEEHDVYISGTGYNFTSDGTGDREVTYVWEIYVNDVAANYDTGTYYWERDNDEYCVLPVRVSQGRLKISCPSALDKQVTHIRIYRTENAGTTFYHDQDISLPLSADYMYNYEWERENIHISGVGENYTIDTDSDNDHITDAEVMFTWEQLIDETTDNMTRGVHQWEPTVIYTDTPDLSLGTAVATNHNRPPMGTFVVGPTHEGICFIGKGKDIYYCLSKRPDYWPTDYYVEVSTKQFPLQNGCVLDGEVYTASIDDIFKMQGAGEGVYTAISLTAITGTRGKNCFVGVHGKGIFHLGIDGIYLYGSEDVNITDDRLRPIFHGETVENVPGVNQDYIDNCWMVYFKNKLYFGYPSSDETYPDNILVANLINGKVVHYDYGQTFMSACVDHDNKRLLAVDTSGYVWELEDEDATDDNGTDISWQIQSKDFSEQLYKYFPRYARYDVTLGTGATATGYILLDGTSKQSHALSTSRNTKKRLVTGCNGDRLSLRITGTGSVDIYAAETG